MCIKKVRSFEYAGKLYVNEIDAVKAALTEIGTRIVRDFHNDPVQGLIRHGADVSSLRDRYLDLLDPHNATEATSKKVSGEPKQ